MSLIRAELERLARALDELDMVLAERDERHAAALEAARRAAEEAARNAAQPAARQTLRVDTRAIVDRVDRTIDKLETVLSR